MSLLFNIMNTEIYIKLFKFRLAEKGKESIIAYGNSMLPLIKSNTVIVVEQTEKYLVGDIVLFEKENELIAHRIIHVNNIDKSFVTCGDNAFFDDGRIGYFQLIGKVIEVHNSETDIYQISRFKLYNKVATITSKSIYNMRLKSKILKLIIYEIFKVIRYIFF